MEINLTGHQHRVIHLFIACQLMFPDSEFIESENISNDDHMIKLTPYLFIQIGAIDEYYLVAEYINPIGVIKTSKDLKTPSMVFRHLQSFLLKIIAQ